MDIELLIDNAATASQCDFDEVTREAIRLNIVNPLLATSQEPAPVAWRWWTGRNWVVASVEPDPKYHEDWEPLYAAPVPPAVGEKMVETLKDAGLTSPDGTMVHGPTAKVVAALASSVAKPCGVKALEWEDGEARTAFGSAYTVHRRADGMYEAVGCGSFMEGPHETRDAAKAAAQADYERRVLSCLSHPAQGWREPEGFTPYLWQCKDYADSWISYANKDEALAYQRDTGCLLRITYRPTAPAGGSGNE